MCVTLAWCQNGDRFRGCDGQGLPFGVFPKDRDWTLWAHVFLCVFVYLHILKGSFPYGLYIWRVLYKEPITAIQLLGRWAWPWHTPPSPASLAKRGGQQALACVRLGCTGVDRMEGSRKLPLRWAPGQEEPTGRDTICILLRLCSDTTYHTQPKH